MSKKVLMVLDEEFPPDDRVYKEAQSLIKNGFSVTIACYTFKDKALIEEMDGIQILRRKIPKLIYKSSVAALKVPVYFNWWIKYLNEVFTHESFDIIHIHDLPLAKVGVYFKEKFDIKLVVDLHENWPAYLERAIHVQSWLGKRLSSNAQWRNYEKTILKHADLIITVVDEMSDRLRQIGITNNTILEVQNVIELERFPDQGFIPDSKHFTLFYAGDITRIRGFQTILKDLKVAKKQIQGLRVWIIGKGNFLEGLKELVAENGLEDIFTFYGWQPLTEVMKMLEQADVGLMPHLRWEQMDCSSPNKLFQYMFKEKPSLNSPANSVNRIVDETQSGLIYDYNIPGDFCEKLMMLYANQELRNTMGASGKKWVLEKYNWKIFAENLVKTYKSLA